MRPIVVASLDKMRPVLVLTREEVRAVRTDITVAPITSTMRGVSTEIPVGPRNGIDHDSVVQCDNIITIKADRLGRTIGYLFPDQEPNLTEAIVRAFDLE
jgi:mRNA interferase MazF